MLRFLLESLRISVSMYGLLKSLILNGSENVMLLGGSDVISNVQALIGSAS